MIGQGAFANLNQCQSGMWGSAKKTLLWCHRNLNRKKSRLDIDNLVQDCSNSVALAVVLLQSYALIYGWKLKAGT